MFRKSTKLIIILIIITSLGCHSSFPKAGFNIEKAINATTDSAPIPPFFNYDTGEFE